MVWLKKVGILCLGVKSSPSYNREFVHPVSNYQEEISKDLILVLSLLQPSLVGAVPSTHRLWTNLSPRTITHRDTKEKTVT
jgi:hypothetical protein